MPSPRRSDGSRTQNCRPAAGPQRLDLLANTHTAQHRIVLQQPVDLVLERIKLRRPLRTPEHRRLIGPQRRPNRVTRQPRPPDQLLNPNTAHEMLTAQLSPPLHVQHASSWPSNTTTRPGSLSPRTPPPTSKGVNSQPAKGGQFLTGADNRNPARLQAARSLKVGYRTRRSATAAGRTAEKAEEMLGEVFGT